MAVTVQRPRAPQQRVLRNHERLLDAALEAVAEEGRPGLTYTGVAARAGLSRRPVQERFPDIAMLAAAVWRERVAAPLELDLMNILEAAGTLGGTGGGAVDEDRLVRLLRAMSRPASHQRAGLELLLVSQWDPQVRAAVDETLGQVLSACLTPGPDGPDEATAARRAYLLALCLGLILLGRRPGIEDIDVGLGLERIAEALRQRPTPSKAVPSHPAPHLDRYHPFDTGDPTLDALLQAVLRQVAQNGFDRASVNSIVRDAESSQGAMFARFDTKLDLFLDACRRQLRSNLKANNDYIAQIAADHGEGIAEAATLREFMAPGRDDLRALTLEQFRLAWYDADLARQIENDLNAFSEEDWIGRVQGRDEATARADFHIGACLGNGAIVLPLLAPGCWMLPYDVVTIPVCGG